MNAESMRQEPSEPFLRSPEGVPKLPAEVQKIVEAAQAEVEKTTAPEVAELEALLAAREVRLARLKQGAGVKEIAALKELEKEISPLRLSLQQVRRTLRKVAPFLIPLAFAGKLARSEMAEGERDWSHRDEAAQQLEHDGITSERRAAYTPGVSEVLYRGITPVGYQDTWALLRTFPENIWTGRETGIVTARDMTAPFPKSRLHERDDAWRLYLGLPQEHGTFGISHYFPEKSTERKYYYSINGWLEAFSKSLSQRVGHDVSPVQSIVDAIHRVNTHEGRLEQIQSELHTLWGQTHFHDEESEKLFDEQSELLGEAHIWVDQIGNGYVITEDARYADGSVGVPGVMGAFKLSLGKDEKGDYISYYDTWDLGGSNVEGEGGLFGKPYEIYDRIYYDPATYQVLP